MPIVSTGDGLSLGVSLVLLEIPDDAWVRQAIVSALNLLTIENNWREIGSNSPELSANIFSLILQTLLFDYEPPDMIPIGTMTEWPGSAAPTNWLLCDGASLLRASYVDLFAVLGTMYGAVDGTHFNLPNMVNRSPMGQGGAIVPDLADTWGAATHSMLLNDLVSHTHAVNDPGHTHPPLSPSTTFFGLKPSSTNSGAVGTTYGVAASTGPANTGISLGNAGSGNPFNIVHPVIGINYIIYAGI